MDIKFLIPVVGLIKSLNKFLRTKKLEMILWFFISLIEFLWVFLSVNCFLILMFPVSKNQFIFSLILLSSVSVFSIIGIIKKT